MDPLLLSLLIAYAIHRGIENGKTEYAHIRDRQASELARTYPDWSPGRVQRVARRAARRYWWGQIRRGFPEVRAAHAENKELAEAARIEAETAGLVRRAEIRERVRKALKEAETIRGREARPAEAATDGPAEDADDTGAQQPAAAADAPVPDDVVEPATQEPSDPAGAHARPDQAEVPDEVADGPTEGRRTAGPNRADSDPAASPDAPAPQPCGSCGDTPAWPHPEGGHRCILCWAPRPAPWPAPAPADDGGVRAIVIPLKQPQAPASAPSTEGDPMTAVPTGEYTGYEAAVANWSAIKQLSQQLLEHYEALMASYRSMNVEDATIDRAATCHEAEEQHLLAVQTASSDFLTRHGAVKETKESTATTGDQAVYNS